jgi:5'-3' exonuclease
MYNMGIPSYFSHIIRNYSNIIRGLKYFNENSIQIHHLFMDCNSIIYDAVRMVDYQTNKKDFENIVIQNVIECIEKYIHYIKPTKTIYIAFDGVAPFAKMEQQRTRRHKTKFMSEVNFENNNEDIISWNTSAITPGTSFMNSLSNQIEYTFSHVSKKYGVQVVNVSTSNEPGEGEHKLFDFLRMHNLSDDNVALYGLDSDLIMLSIYHITKVSNIYIFREAPEFLKNSLPVEVSKDKDIPYFLDIKLFANCILNNMQCVDNNIQRVYDYVFLCFFLGNDFLPHFPAMNIRTHGIDVLLDIYCRVVGKIPNNYIVNLSGKINWNNVRKLLENIAKDEHKYLLNEYNARRKFDHFKFAETTTEEKEKMFQNTPIIYRSQEKYISPENSHWESRYYKSLFKTESTDSFKKKVCLNYLEALEWVFKYYTSGCPDWLWKYDYSYPPLFKDLVKYVPHFETDFIKDNENAPLNPFTQLAYVLPIQNHFLLPEKISSILKKKYSKFYADKYNFEWAFCRYFWESHPLLPEISKNVLLQWNNQFTA